MDYDFPDEVEHASQLALRSGLNQPLDLHLCLECGKTFGYGELRLLSERLGRFLPRVESLYLEMLGDGRYEFRSLPASNRPPVAQDTTALRWR